MASATCHRFRPWLLTLAGCGVLFWLVSPSLTQPQPDPAPSWVREAGGQRQLFSGFL